jgi:chemotaxis protein MotB
MKRPILGLAVVLLGLGGCVTKAEHERALADAAGRLRAVEQKAAADLAAAQSQVVSLQDQLTRLGADIAERDQKITALQAEIAGLQKKLDDATALNQQLGDELKKAGKNVDTLLAEQGKIHQALEDAKSRLEELRKAQAAAQKRADLYRQLVGKFQKMIDAGDLEIKLRDGRMVLQLRNDVLFDSGQVVVKQAGMDALKEVAGVLKTLTDRKLQVAGHTDNVPMATERFPSNWELSAGRAIAVVKYLMSQGVAAEVISAAGYGEHDPVAPNDTPADRARNRRIEIVLQPNLSELVSMPAGES